MQMLLSVHGSKSVHSCIEVVMNFVCFAKGKTNYLRRWQAQMRWLLIPSATRPAILGQAQSTSSLSARGVLIKNNSPGRPSPKDLTLIDRQHLAQMPQRSLRATHTVKVAAEGLEYESKGKQGAVGQLTERVAEAGVCPEGFQVLAVSSCPLPRLPIPCCCRPAAPAHCCSSLGKKAHPAKVFACVGQRELQSEVIWLLHSPKKSS